MQGNPPKIKAKPKRKKMTRYERDAQDYIEDAKISVLVSENNTD
jgi:hypothetical protein